MCLYKLRPERPLKKFYCLKLKEILLACPPACPYYVHHPGGSFDAFLHALKCINLDFVTIDGELVTICLVIPSHTPDCNECPTKKEHSTLLLLSLNIPGPQDKTKVQPSEGELKEEWYSNKTTGGNPHA